MVARNDTHTYIYSCHCQSISMPVQLAAREKRKADITEQEHIRVDGFSHLTRDIATKMVEVMNRCPITQPWDMYRYVTTNRNFQDCTNFMLRRLKILIETTDPFKSRTCVLPTVLDFGLYYFITIYPSYAANETVLKVAQALTFVYLEILSALGDPNDGVKRRNKTTFDNTIKNLIVLNSASIQELLTYFANTVKGTPIVNQKRIDDDMLLDQMTRMHMSAKKPRFETNRSRL